MVQKKTMISSDEVLLDKVHYLKVNLILQKLKQKHKGFQKGLLTKMSKPDHCLQGLSPLSRKRGILP